MNQIHPPPLESDLLSPEPDYPATTRVRRHIVHQGSPWFIMGVGSFILMGIMVCAWLGLVTGWAYIQVSEQIVSGVQVGGVQVGGLTVEAAALPIDTAWNHEQRLRVSDGLQNWELIPRELGLHVDAQETAEQAYRVGRSGGFLVNLKQIWTCWWDGWQIAPVVNLEVTEAVAGLTALDALARVPAKDARVAWDGEKFYALPSELGYALNLEESLWSLSNNKETVMASGYFEVPLKPLLPQFNDASPALAEAERLLATPVQLQGYDPITDELLQVPVTRQVYGSWLQVIPGPQGLQVDLDETRLEVYFESLGDQWGDGRYIDVSENREALVAALQKGQPLTLIIRHATTTYTVQPGDTLLRIGWQQGFPYWMITEANPGLAPDALYAGQTLIIPSKDELLPLPVVLGKRIVISISKQRLWVYQNGELLSKHLISTGIDRSPTQPGVFQVRTHERAAYASVWDLTMPDFLGIYEAWPGFMNGIHGLPTLSNGRRLWANILGKPASYGCIILDLETAAWLYDWAENGVVVAIEP